VKANLGRLAMGAIVLATCLLFDGASRALTPIDAATLSPDTTIELDAGTYGDEDVAIDDVVLDSVSAVSLGVLPANVSVAAYHELVDGDRLFVLDTTAVVGGLTASPLDVVRYDGVSYSVEFAGAAAGLPRGARIDGVSQIAGDLVLSFDVSVALPFGTAADEDLVQYAGLAFNALFDGSAAGIAPSLDVDGVHRFLSNGHITVSLDGSGVVGGIAFDDEDVLEYDPVGATWEMAWDGSVERAAWAPADVESVYFVPEPSVGTMLMAGVGALAVLGLRGGRREAPGSTSG
jgi:hypothetical protein